MTNSPRGLVFLPLGGSGEIGMNLNLYGYDDQWIMVDLGVSFADEVDSGRRGLHGRSGLHRGAA